MTRDGGHKWTEIKDSSLIYEIGDMGGLVVVGRDDKNVKKLSFTYDEGITWDDIKVANDPFSVQNIISEPTNIEQ